MKSGYFYRGTSRFSLRQNMMQYFPTQQLIELARVSVMHTKSGSVARLQSDLGLSHGIAAALVERLEDAGVLLPAFGKRLRMVNQRFLPMYVRNIADSPRTRYVRRIVETALFFFECWEEGRVGDHRAINALRPSPGPDYRVLRGLFLDKWYGAERRGLEGAALAFHAYLVEAGHLQQVDAALAEAVAVECIQHAREPRFSFNRIEQVDRAHVRLARYYRQMVSDGVRKDSRAAEWFIAKDFVPVGMSRTGLFHHYEHVVPCSVIRDIALRYYADERPIDDVVRLIFRSLAIVRISGGERDRLDTGSEALKHTMPIAWDEESGCIYARLHAKGIGFIPHELRRCDCRECVSHEAVLLSR